MPNNLTDDATSFSSPIQVPAPTDPRTDTSVATPFQQLANRTANTKARLDALVPFSAPGAAALPAGVTSGVATMVSASSLAVMQTIAAASRVDGMVCFVKGIGIYQFDIASTATAASPAVVQPGDVAGGSPGRWFLFPYGTFGVANGVAQLDANTRIAAATVKNGIIGTHLLQPTNQNITTQSWTAMGAPQTSWTSSLKTNDIVLIQFAASIQLQAATSTSVSSVAFYVTPPGGGATPISNGTGSVENKSSAGNQPLQTALTSIYVVPSDGTYTFALYTANTMPTPASGVNYTAMNIAVLDIRP